MELNKLSHKADAIANLYRAALFLAKGEKKIGLDFFEKAKNKLPFLFEIPKGKLQTHSQQLFWAEKILDEYLRLKNFRF